MLFLCQLNPPRFPLSQFDFSRRYRRFLVMKPACKSFSLSLSYLQIAYRHDLLLRKDLH